MITAEQAATPKWKRLISDSPLSWILLGPLVGLIIYFLPLDFVTVPQEQLLLSVIAVMVTWWITEAIPIPVTALLPIIAFPIFNILDLNDVTNNYANPIIFLFLGGFILALAMEKWHLHRRIALHIILLFGSNIRQLVLGFMCATAFLSMWISNTATAVMMLPIALSILTLVTHHPAIKASPKDQKAFAACLLIGLAYAANIGGTATLIGTPPNAIMVGYLENTYHINIDFVDWMKLAVPFAFTMLLVAWALLTYVLFPPHIESSEVLRSLIQREIMELGPMRKEEWWVGGIFATTALLWIIKPLINEAFLDYNLPFGQLSDAGIALFSSFLLFVIPSDLKQKKFLMDWEQMHYLPWGILLLFGGGLSIAYALAGTQMIETLAAMISDASYASLFIATALLSVIVLLLTELMSNMALASLFLPIASTVALHFGVNPLFMLIPVTLASSCAFMMPIATPPNAIVFASKQINTAQMVKAGAIVNILSLILIMGFLFLLAEMIFGARLFVVPFNAFT